MITTRSLLSFILCLSLVTACGGGGGGSGDSDPSAPPPEIVYGSSHNASRIETIDYVWADADHFEVAGRSSLGTPMPDGTPDPDNPSDHIPLVVHLRWKDSGGEGRGGVADGPATL